MKFHYKSGLLLALFISLPTVGPMFKKHPLKKLTFNLKSTKFESYTQKETDNNLNEILKGH